MSFHTPLVAPPGELAAGASGVTLSGLDPAAAALGRMVGLLRDGTDGSLSLDTAWFESPLEKTSRGVRDDPAKVADLLAQLLGEVGGRALGVPVKDPALLGTWYPIRNPATQLPTGLYVVSYERGAGAEKTQVFGLGAFHRWSLPAGAPALTVNAWGLVPIVRVGRDGVQPVLNVAGYPITLGIAAEGPQDKDAEPLVNTHGFRFNGVKVSAALDVASPAHPVTLALSVLQLRLPGDDQPADRSLADLAAVPGTQIIEAASSLFLAALAEMSVEARDRAEYLLPVLGLASAVPRHAAPLPVLRWDRLFALAAKGEDLTEPFRDWFQALTADPARVRAWLGAVAGLLGSTGATVAGDGSRAHPFRVPVADLTSSKIGVLSFTVASVVDAAGARRLYPGLAFLADPRGIGSAELRLSADLEVAEFVLTGGTPRAAVPTLRFDAGMRLASATAGEPLAGAEGYRFGALEAGVSLGMGSALVPAFRLVDVATPESAYASLDLLSPGELAVAGGIALEGALRKLLGVADGRVPFAANVAALLGVINPRVPAGAAWPAELAAPLTRERIADTFRDPPAAMAGWYQRVLASPTLVDGKTAFTWLLQELAALLANAADTVHPEVTGGGTAADPWRATLSLGDRTLPAALTGFRADAGPGFTRLVLGMELAPVLELAGTKVVPSITAHFLSLDLPHAGTPGRPTGLWGRDVQARIDFPTGFTTPPIATAALEVKRAALSARWSRVDGWHWSLFAGQPVLRIGETEVPLGGDLDFSDAASFRALVTTGEKAFAPLLAGVLGVALLRTRTRAGTAAAGVLGLLPEIGGAPVYPRELAWPASMPRLALEGLADPRPAIRAQLAAILSSPDTAKPALALLGWVLNPSRDDAPAVEGGGTPDAPYRVPVAGSGFEGLLWYGHGDARVLGVGLGRTDLFHFGEEGAANRLRVTVATRLAAAELSLATGAPLGDGHAPALSFTATLARAAGTLAEFPGGAASVGRAVLGLSLRLDRGDGSAPPSLVLAPVVALEEVTLPGEPTRARVTLDDLRTPAFQGALGQAFVSLVNAALQAAVDQAGVRDAPGFRTAYALLTALGLTLQKEKDGGYGINPAGWQALLADPTVFARDRFPALLADVELRAELFRFVREQLHLSLPTLPRAAAVVLEALGFVGPQAQGWPLRPEALLELARNPFSTLAARFARLATDTAARQALVTALVGEDAEVPIGPARLRVRAGTEVSLELDPANALDVAGVLRLSGAVSFSLTDLTLDAGLRLFNPSLGLALVPALSLRVADGAAHPAFTARVEWGGGSRPAAEPLTLVPFDSGRFVDQLAALAPPYVLNVLVGAVAEARLLDEYPLARQLFEGLGIAREVDGRWTVPAVLGLLRDPRGWLLSEGILGRDGRFDLGTFGALLRRLPEVGDRDGLRVERTATGARVAGLPYHFRVEMGSTAERATLGLSTGGFAIAAGKGKVEALGLTVALGADGQPGVTGRLTLATGEGFATTPYLVTAGYDGGFLLEVGERPPGVEPPPPLRLLPFQGWGTLVEEGARRVAPALLRELSPRLLAALQAQGGPVAAVAARLRTVGGELQVDALAAALAATSPFTPREIERTALRWLLERFSEAHAPGTARAVAEVFRDLVPGVVDTVDGLVRYRPAEALPLALLVGVDDAGGRRLLGAWADVRMPPSVVRVEVKRTGVGIPVPRVLPASLAELEAPVFSFGVAVRVPVDGDVGPELLLSYDQKRVVLAFDPLGGGGRASALSRELLPELFPRAAGDNADRWKRVEAWLVGVSTDVLPRYLSSVVLNTPRVKAWLEAPIVGTEKDAPRPVDVLKATSLVVAREADGAPRYSLNALDELKRLTPEAFLGSFLRALLRTRITLLRFGKDGRIVVGPRPGDATRFGILVAAPELAIPGVDHVVLRLGDADAEWIEKAGGDARCLEPGISLYVPVVDEGSGLRPRFGELELNLVNVGVDVKGKGKAPLVDLGRFRLGAVKPRALLTLRMKAWKPAVTWGAGVELSGIGISLAPNALAGESRTNPVAQNLLGSGTNQKADNPPTNPTFSVSAAYADKLWVRLHGDGPDRTRVILPVQRSFGPLYVGSLGLGWKDAERRLEVLFSGRVALAGLNAEVLGLAVGIPVTTPANPAAYTLELQGLDLSFRGGPVQIGGALLKQENPLAYTGTVLVKAGKFSIVGLGAYAMVPTRPGADAPLAPSLFLFAALRAPLGGHPAFFITGLAAGFSFNRNLTLPAIGDVHQFPLVRGVVDGSFGENEEPGSALQKLAEVVKPEIGQYWVAAGITFTTFKLLDSAALLFLRFGREWEVALIGLSRASLPPQVPRDRALAYIELAFKVSVRPGAGVITAQAQLTPNSFVLTRECKLTGGFAFYLWFADVQADGYVIPAGDFVVTLGGYHPAFSKPAHYPDVPRLGFSWLMNAAGGTVSIAGGAYFALVPTAVMAGGFLQVTFQAGPLRAWLQAYANFLIEWKPFYYEASIGVSVGVAFSFRILGITITLKVELGADLELAGPPTHGVARVHWWVLTFTIPFGEPGTGGDTDTLTWAAFEQSFLPAPQPASRPRAAAAAPAPAEGKYPRQGQQVVKLGAVAGLLRQDEEWVVRPVNFALRVETAVPTRSLTVKGSGAVLDGAEVGVRPMAMVDALNVPVTVTVTGPQGVVNLDERGVTLQPLKSGAPAALWSRQALNRRQAPDPSGMVVEGALIGVLLRADRYVIVDGVGPFPLTNLSHEEGPRIDLPLAHPPTRGPSARYPEADQLVAFRRIRESVMAPSVIPVRNAALAALRTAGVDAPASPGLSVMAAAADLLFTARPVLARIGVYQPGPGQAATAALTPPAPRRLAAPAPPAAEAQPAAAPELQGIRRRYAQPAPPRLWMASAAGDDAAAPHPPAAGSTSERWTDADDALPRLPRAAPRAAAPAGVTLYDGTLALWKVDPAARHALRHDGALAALATCFGPYGEIMARVTVAPGAESPLPAGTGQVAVHGGEAAGGGALGWERETALTKANSAYALGDGFALRTQNLSRVRRLSRTLARGTVDAGRLLDDNQASDVGGVRQGWVETVFFQPYPLFAVVVHSPAGDAAAAVRVSARRSERAGETGGEALRPSSSFARGGATVLVFAAPEPAEGEEGPAAFLSVLMDPVEPGARILGAWGIDRSLRAAATPMDSARAAWRAPRAPAPALSLDVEEPPRARVSIVPAETGT
jgi:hypothetical protein